MQSLRNFPNEEVVVNFRGEDKVQPNVSRNPICPLRSDWSRSGLGSAKRKNPIGQPVASVVIRAIYAQPTFRIDPVGHAAATLHVRG